MNQIYELWKEKVTDEALKEELLALEGNDKEIYERFYKELEFGTGGLRGVIAAGTNRMNVYTVGKATQGLSDYINESFTSPSVAVAYDSRKFSDVFARHTASVFAANGIKVWLYPTLAPTPMLSFAVRHLKTSGGIVVTASHNPAKYNGYKAYGPDGCQFGVVEADAVLAKIASVDVFEGVKTVDFETALAEKKIEYIGQDVVEAFYEKVLSRRINAEAPKAAGLKIVYSPLNGTGNVHVREVLKRAGHGNVTVVKEQELPDSNFTTCPFPNPEIREALALGLKVCEEQNADLLVATDPDADRMGIAVRGENGFELVTGNEVGAMMLDYICKSRIANGTMPKDPVAVKTIVSTDIAMKIAKKYGVHLADVLTGFKFIGEQIAKLEAAGREDAFLLGFEESYGYLAGTYVRDKDAVVASMLICEMAAFYALEGKTLLDVRKEMYEEHGYFLNHLENYQFEGSVGMKKMAELMDFAREDRFRGVKELVRFRDYRAKKAFDLANGTEEEIDLPSSNVLAFEFVGGGKLIIRPSGTEPKIKLYYTTVGASKEESKAAYDALSKTVRAYFSL